jgi:hypothetical protein
MNVSVNALDRSHNLEYAVTGDDYSLVKIFNYPVVHDDAPWRVGSWQLLPATS